MYFNRCFVSAKECCWRPDECCVWQDNGGKDLPVCWVSGLNTHGHLMGTWVQVFRHSSGFSWQITPCFTIKLCRKMVAIKVFWFFKILHPSSELFCNLSLSSVVSDVFQHFYFNTFKTVHWILTKPHMNDLYMVPY